MANNFSAKDITIKPIDATTANAFVKKYHYSGKIVPNSQVHFGVYLPDNRLHGVMQFGPSLDKRKMLTLVRGSSWNEFCELNRMAFDDILPRNSESRAISIAIKIIKKKIPSMKWIISFADGTQCGDGTIYRASGFVLTAIKENSALWEIPGTGKVAHQLSFTTHGGNKVVHELTVKIGKSDFYNQTNGKASVKSYMENLGAKPLKGFQLRYIYFIDKEAQKNLTVPVIPFSKIEEMGASMYKGKRTGGGSLNSKAAEHPSAVGGADPTPPLQNIIEGQRA